MLLDTSTENTENVPPPTTTSTAKLDNMAMADRTKVAKPSNGRGNADVDADANNADTNNADANNANAGAHGENEEDQNQDKAHNKDEQQHKMDIQRHNENDNGVLSNSSDHGQILPTTSTSTSTVEATTDNNNDSNNDNNDKKIKSKSKSNAAPTKYNNETTNTNDMESKLLDLTKPLKKGRSAYFIFQSEKRSQVLKELTDEINNDTNNTTTTTTTTSNTNNNNNNKASVASVAKRIGQLWSNLSTEEKEIYQIKAREEKELYERHKAALAQQGIDIDQDGENSSTRNSYGNGNSNGNPNGKGNDNHNPISMIFPVSRIRKISRLDPDVKGMSKESTILITKATELFLQKMARDTMSMTQMHQKRTIHTQDIVDICSLKELFFFLKDDMRDLILEQKEEKRRKKRKLNTMTKNKWESVIISNDGPSLQSQSQSSSLSSSSATAVKGGRMQQSKKIKATEMTLKGVKPLTSYFTTTKK